MFDIKKRTRAHALGPIRRAAEALEAHARQPFDPYDPSDEEALRQALLQALAIAKTRQAEYKAARVGDLALDRLEDHLEEALILAQELAETTPHAKKIEALKRTLQQRDEFERAYRPRAQAYTYQEFEGEWYVQEFPFVSALTKDVAEGIVMRTIRNLEAENAVVPPPGFEPVTGPRGDALTRARRRAKTRAAQATGENESAPGSDGDTE